MKKIKLSFGILIILLLIIPLVSSFGVTTHYWETKPLLMSPGQTKDVDVVLQNQDDEDLKVKAEITEGSEIAELIDPNLEYTVLSRTKDTKVNIRVTIPENVPLENKYIIKISFLEIAEKDGQMLQLTSSIGTKIPVIIKSSDEVPEEDVPVEPKETAKTEEKISTTTLILLLLITIAIIYIISQRKKIKKKNVKNIKKKKK